MTATRDRTGELIDPDAAEHRCDGGWLDRDADQPRPCGICRPRLARQLARRPHRFPQHRPALVVADVVPLIPRHGHPAADLADRDEHRAQLLAEHDHRAAAAGAGCRVCGFLWWPSATSARVHERTPRT